ncbi:hypothetical protein Y032_0271g895 [Ancylostoma ceylanicum]|uniref:C-type lectin domain-containing protein n=1 Tax=Ancylostoma ceylanicum TaxID=53326 RepID=A0A016S8D9_9BILA|nr:hypothetical protein Y032_0271g895 [Ancylostoma ceylanicum]
MFIQWATIVISLLFLENVSPQEKCESEWKRFSRAFYKRYCNATFDEAEKTCQSEDGHLVSIHSKEENQFVHDLICPMDTTKNSGDHLNGNIWIGLRKDEKGVWRWVDGTEMDFKLWTSGEPNNYGGNEDCGHMYIYDAPSWNDVRCNRRMRFFICKTVMIIEKL